LVRRFAENLSDNQPVYPSTQVNRFYLYILHRVVPEAISVVKWLNRSWSAWQSIQWFSRKNLPEFSGRKSVTLMALSVFSASPLNNLEDFLECLPE